MTPEQASEALDNLAKLIAENIPEITQTIALTAKQKIQDRIQERGLSDELVSFPGYSPSYKKYKANKKGERTVAFRNLTLEGGTTGMWGQTDIISTGITSRGYEVVVGGRDEFTKNKIDWNAEQIGDFLKVSDQEDAELASDYDAELDKLIAESGLG